MASPHAHHVDTDPDAAILLSIEIYLSLLVLGFVAFELLRPRLLVYFNCRATDPKASCPLAETVYGFGGWIAPVLRATDDEIMEFCGLDALCYLRFLRLGRNIAGASILLSFGLMPIYATAVRPDGEALNVTSAQDVAARLAMANMNVSLDPNRLWAPVAAGFVITIYTLRLLVAEYKVYVSRRHEFLGRDGLQQYTVIMNDLPPQLRTHEALTKYLHKLFPTMVDSVHMAMECRELEAQVAKRERVRGDLERAMVTAVQTGHRPTTAFKRGQVDAIDHFSQLLEKLNISIRTEIETLRGYQAKLHEVMNEDSLEDALCVSSMHDSNEDDDDKAPEFDPIPITTMLSFMRPSAFVTFNTLQATQSALQMLQTDTPSEMLVRPAPDPADILWDNLGRTLNSLSSWQLASTLATLVIIVLWSVPTVLATTLGAMDQWRDQYTSVDQTLHDHPWLVDFCKQMAPLGLVALSGLAPYVFGALSRREGLASQTEVDASTFSKLVSFQFVQTFVVALLSGSLNSLLPVLIDSPYLFVTIFSEALSLQASLYISIMAILTGLVLPCKLFRVGSFLRGFLYHVFAPHVTPRERRSPWKWLAPMSAIETCSQSTILPSYFLVLLLVLVFCPMTPLVGYFGGLLFLVSDVVYRRLFFFVYAPGRFTTGVYWPSMYKCIVRALYMAQLILIALMWVKVSDAWTNRVEVRSGPKTSVSVFEQYAYWFAMAPSIVVTFLPLLTYVVDHRVRALYPRASTFLPLVDCYRIDSVRTSSQFVRAPAEQHRDNSMYIQPALRSGSGLKTEFTFAQAQRMFKPVKPASQATTAGGDHYASMQEDAC